MKTKQKNKIIYGIFILIFTFIITACGKEELGNAYIEGSDYQYMFNRWDNFFQTKARGENGYFFLRGHYIYYFDDTIQQLTPLCNKVDCLHDKEIDEKQYAKCNAYLKGEMGGTGSIGISYCNGYLYFTDIQSTVEGEFYTLYRIKEDGSQKELLYQWNFWNDSIQQWCIHRETLYFVNHKYIMEKDENGIQQNVEKYYVKKMALTGVNACKEEIIYESNEAHSVFSLANIEGYGNYIYFEELGNTVKDTSVVTDENYLDYTYHYRMAYNIETGKLTELKIPQEEGIHWLQEITFWKDKLVLTPSDPMKEWGESRKVYIADLDGSNVEVLFEDTKNGQHFFSDGNYLYISNSKMVNRGIEDTQYYEIYDKDLNLVDTVQMPFEGGGEIEIGYEDKCYFFLENEEKTGMQMHCFDKSTIGTYDGKPFATTIVAEYLYSKADLKDLEEFE